MQLIEINSKFRQITKRLIIGISDVTEKLFKSVLLPYLKDMKRTKGNAVYFYIYIYMSFL